MTPQLTVGSLFSGIGGLDLAVERHFGARTVWHCEWDPEPSKVLAARWPGVPNYRDVTKVDWATVEPVDIMCGGFPCQDVSLAGRRRGMKSGTRSGLWAEFARAIEVLKPKVVVIENVQGLRTARAGGVVEPCPWCLGDAGDGYHLRALDAVLATLSDLGFDAEWTNLRASDVGAPHGRFRYFILAYARGVRLDERWDAAPLEAPGGWPPALPAGRGGAPVALLGTPRTAQAMVNDSRDPARIGDPRGRLEDQIALLPTPIVSDGTGGPKKLEGAEFAPQLREIVQLLPTPITRDANSVGGSTPHDQTLSDVVERTQFGTRPNPRHLLPTPSTRNVSGNDVNNRGDLQLPGVARSLLPTPVASEAEKGGPGQKHGGGDATLSGTVAELTVNWGEYEGAVRRWEALTRPAPAPTLPDGRGGRHRLSARFPEWMMGYDDGWITDIIGRNAAIKACGNGVVPQQAQAAIVMLWGRLRSEGVL